MTNCHKFLSKVPITKLNSNPYQYKLKFISTSKQKYNSKFQKFETTQTVKLLKKQPNLDQTNFLKLTIIYLFLLLLLFKAHLSKFKSTKTIFKSAE